MEFIHRLNQVDLRALNFLNMLIGLFCYKMTIDVWILINVIFQGDW